MILTAYPKINLGLDILRRREDGFHEIDTLMLPFRGVGDTLEIVPTIDGAIHLDTNGLTIDCASDRNLVVKAWLLLHNRYGIGGRSWGQNAKFDRSSTQTFGSGQSKTFNTICFKSRPSYDQHSGKYLLLCRYDSSGIKRKKNKVFR